MKPLNRLQATTLHIRVTHSTQNHSKSKQSLFLAMFNALNRFISRLDSDSPANDRSYGAFGFQVLSNKSPELAIEPWFDFIVGINGRMIVSKVKMQYMEFIDNVRMTRTHSYSVKKLGIALGAQLHLGSGVQRSFESPYLLQEVLANN